MRAVFASDAICNGNTVLSLKLSCEHPPCQLGRNIHGEVLSLIADVLRDARVTRRLSLVIDFQITAWVASQLEGLSGLESLKLCRGGTAPSVLINALRAKPAMRALTLQSCGLSNEDAPLLAMVLRDMPLLETLDLSDNALGGSMALVAPALPSGLKRLGLEANDMDDAGAEILASALRGKKGLKHLEIGCNAFGAWAHQGSGGALLLSSLEGLEHLDLACNPCDLECLAGCFKMNPGLKHLTLHGTFHHRAGDGVESLGLHKLKMLTHLNLCGNALAVEDGLNAVAQLARTLREMPWLECLDLSHNEFGAEAIRELIPALAGMPGLRELDFSGNDLMAQPDWSPAVGLLKALPGLQKLRCEEAGIERTALEEMVEVQALAPNRLVLIARNFDWGDVEGLNVEALEDARIFWG
jgi:Ran GTPase-activating protein (RanGAP) involved in mRNA processing and transport